MPSKRKESKKRSKRHGNSEDTDLAKDTQVYSESRDSNLSSTPSDSKMIAIKTDCHKKKQNSEDQRLNNVIDA